MKIRQMPSRSQGTKEVTPNVSLGVSFETSVEGLMVSSAVPGCEGQLQVEAEETSGR